MAPSRRGRWTHATAVLDRSIPGMTDLLPFLGISLVVIVTPGQDTALTIRNAVRGGSRAGASTAIGVSAGQATWTLVTAAGLGALLAASEGAYGVLRMLGIGYLLYLGSRSVWTAIRSDQPPRASANPNAGRGSAIAQGFASNLTNPKMLAFFTSLLPQFADSFGGMVARGLAFSLLTMAWLMTYALAVGRMARVLGRPWIVRSTEALTGGVLIAFALVQWAEPW